MFRGALIMTFTFFCFSVSIVKYILEFVFSSFRQPVCRSFSAHTVQTAATGAQKAKTTFGPQEDDENLDKN